MENSAVLGSGGAAVGVGGGSGLTHVSNRQYLYNQNDQRSKIRVINPSAIGEFVDKFEKLINE